MAKKNLNKNKIEMEDDSEDFFELESPYVDLEETMISEMMGSVTEASNHQSRLAFDLTRLIVEKSSGPIDAEEVFSLFKKASKVVAEHLPLKAFWEKLN